MSFIRNILIMLIKHFIIYIEVHNILETLNISIEKDIINYSKISVFLRGTFGLHKKLNIDVLGIFQ